ncbi:MAG: hypothetical protein ABI806_18050 [Candidatus Solibacter sp.]
MPFFGQNRPTSSATSQLIKVGRIERVVNRLGFHSSRHCDNRKTAVGQPAMRRWPIWLVALGGVILIPGGIWFSTSRTRLTKNDDATALQPLIRIPLASLHEQPLTTMLTIPKSPPWARIRRAWGEPEFVISASEPTGRTVMCLSSMPVRIEVVNTNGSAISMQAGAGPYGYSDYCSGSSLRFQATGGSVLTLKITKVELRPVPAGDVIVLVDWWNTKDKLVGVALDEETGFLLKRLSIAGILLIAVGAMLVVWDYSRRQRPV